MLADTRRSLRFRSGAAASPSWSAIVQQSRACGATISAKRSSGPVPRSWARDWRGLATRSTEIRTRTRRREPDREEGPQAPARDARWAHLDPRLAEELSAGGWDHGWRLTPTAHAPLATIPRRRQETWTLEGMIEPFARDQLALAEERSALDLNCGEGWLAQRLLGWGARRVVAIETAPVTCTGLVCCGLTSRSPETELDLRPAEAAATERGESLRHRPARRSAPNACSTIGWCRALASRPGASARSNRSAADSVAATKLALAAGFTSVERVPPPLQASSALRARRAERGSLTAAGPRRRHEARRPEPGPAQAAPGPESPPRPSSGIPRSRTETGSLSRGGGRRRLPLGGGGDRRTETCWSRAAARARRPLLLTAGARAVAGVDRIERAVEVATRLYGERIRFLAAEPTALPLASASFDS